VLAAKDSSAKTKAYLDNSWTLLKAGTSFGFSKATGIQTEINQAWNELNKLAQRIDTSGEAYAHIFRKHGQTKLADTIEQIASAYKPMPGMQEIVQEINQNKYTQRIASNI